MLCTCPQASQLAAPVPTSPGIESPSSAHPWSSKSPPQMRRFSSKRESFSSTVAALSGLCGQLHLPSNALSAGVSVTQLLAARKSTPNAAASMATPRTQPEPTHATNALQSQSCRRRSMASAHRPHPSASIAVPTTQQTLPLSKACRSACRTAGSRKQTGSRLSSQLSYAVLPVTPGVFSRDPRSQVHLI